MLYQDGQDSLDIMAAKNHGRSDILNVDFLVQSKL